MSKEGYKKYDIEPIRGAMLFVIEHSLIYEFGQCAQRTGMTFQVISTQNSEIKGRKIDVPEGFALLRLFEDPDYKGQRLLDFGDEFKLTQRKGSGMVIVWS